MTKTTSSIFLIILLTSCSRDLTIENVVITERLFSPDGSYVSLTYHVDNGAMGESSSMTSVLKVTDTTELLNNSRLPCLDLPFNACYFPDKWLDSKILQVFLNERPFVKAGIPFKAEDFDFNGIHLKVTPYDYSYENTPLIEHFSFSPDKTKLLVAYRYRGVSELNISVINYLEPLPRIGNVFTNTEISWNPVVFAKWNGNNIDFILNNAQEYKQSDYLNKNIKINTRFVDIDDYGKPLKSREYWMNSQLYNDSNVDSILNNNRNETDGKIVEARWRKPEGKSLFYYEYEYTVKGKTYRSYFSIIKEFDKGYDYQKGDKVKLVYDSNQPLIHKTANGYSR